MVEWDESEDYLTTRRSINAMAVGLLTTLTGCGAGSSQSPSSEPTSTSTPKGPVSYSPTNAQVGEEVVFDASDITEITWKDGFESRDGQVTEYHWDFDNNGTYEGRGISSSHTFEEPGQHVVSLKMIADCSGFSCGLGFQRDITKTITVPVSVAGESEVSNPVNSTADSDVPTGIEIDTQNVNILLNSVRTRVREDETALLQFSATNYIGNDQLHIQLIIEAPNDWSVTGVGSVESGGGQYSSTYDINSGNNKSIQIQITPQQKGRYEITGRVIYYLGEETSTRQNREFVVPITVV
jgi:plastocyanin